MRVAAHDTTLLHERDPDYFWIALGASNVVNAKPGVPDAVIASKDLSIQSTQPLNCPSRSKPQFAATTEHPAFASDVLDTATVRQAPVIVGPGRWIGGAYRPAAGAKWQLQNHEAVPIPVLLVTPRR